MKQKWGMEQYIELCFWNERKGLAWMKAWVWKLEGLEGDVKKEHTPLCRGNEDAKHIPLSCPETNGEYNL
jgi:hypothetical protein